MYGVFVALAWSPLAWAQWTVVGDGIEYRPFTVSGPNNAFVTRMARTNTNTAIESSLAMGKLSTTREIVRNQASRYDEAINYWGQVWGQRNDVIVAVNGDFFSSGVPGPTGGQIQSGWYCKRFPEFGGWSGMVWNLNRGVFMGGCVANPAAKQIVKYVATGQTQQIRGINTTRSTDDLILYTHHQGLNTQTDNTGVEVLVELPRPLLILPSPSMVTGTVREIRQNQGSSLIPFDYVVISATGSRAATLLANVSVGAEVGFSQEVADYQPGCSTPFGHDWTKAYSIAGGNFIYLADGVYQPTTNPGLTARNPRTAVAYNNDYVFFIVVDGRSTSSVGMSMSELATFSINSLSATWGYNMDGGGSSTMVVNGVVKNVPSDGSERAVANGLMMINVLPRQQSATFFKENVVKTNTNAAVRLGPGTNFESPSTLGNNIQGIVLDHPMNGLYAKGQYWWKCDFSGTVGWVQENQLTFVSGGRPPSITQQPIGQSVAFGTTVVFSVQAESAIPISYQWQRNQLDLSNGGPYSGVLTSALTVTGADRDEAGSYRCLVTNDHGTATSSEATLTVRSPDFDGDDDADLSDFAYLQLCLGIPDVSQVPGCSDADLDGNLSVNTADMYRFKGCGSGAAIPLTPGCLP